MSKFYNALAVAVLGIALLMGAASATDMTITATIQSFTEVTVSPASFSWTLAQGANTYTTTATTSTISTNAVAGATLNVKESVSGTGDVNSADGNMYSKDATHALGSDLVLDALTPIAATDVTLSGTNQPLYVLAAAGSQVVDFDYTQAVALTDPAATDYSAVVTFTAA